MTRGNSTKLSKKEQMKQSSKKDVSKQKKRVMSSDDEDDNDNDDDDFIESDTEEMDIQEFRKYVQKIFPSKHLENKIKAGEKLKKIKKLVEVSDEEDWETQTEEEEKPQKKSSKKKKYVASDDETASLGSQDTPIKHVKSKNRNKFDVIFTVEGLGEDEDSYYEDDCSDSDYETENEDDDVSTDTSASFDEDDEDKDEDNKKYMNEKIDTSSVLHQLKELLSKNPKDKSIEKCIDIYEEDMKKTQLKMNKKEKKQKKRNMRIFKKIISDKNTLNDFAFYEKMNLTDQKNIIKELREINKITRIEKPYRMTLLESSIPVEFKATAIKKINTLRYMEPGSGEFYKIKNWVDAFMKIPFTEFQSLPLSIEDGVEKCHDFMEQAQKTLDTAVYGLNDAKMQIMQMLGQLLTNPKAIGTAIAIHGPPGTGKTSLVKEGISKILNRPFAFIALGGATDSSFLEGHGYTYEGSTWGKIVQIIIDSKCMNPVIYFDELDKISDTPRGEEIAGILTHLTDTTQNSQFHDKYFAEINFDLSKCLFIFSYNDESKVNPILKDRMYRIKTKGYSGKEKNIISNNYLLPKIREQVRFNEGDIIISDEVLSYINDTHCQKEDGVRNMKRCLEIIYTKLNLYRLMKPNSNLFEGEMSLKVEFPFKVSKDIVDKLIKKDTDGIETWRSLYN